MRVTDSFWSSNGAPDCRGAGGVGDDGAGGAERAGGGDELRASGYHVGHHQDAAPGDVTAVGHGARAVIVLDGAARRRRPEESALALV